MAAAADAAAARYPQAVSLEDPMLGVTGGPRVFNHTDDGGYRVELSQKYPWPGKRCLRGQNAAAEARAAGQDLEDMRLQLVQSARDAFADYYLAGRGLAVNRQALDLLESVRSQPGDAVQDRQDPRAGFAPDQVEIGRQRQRQLTLERMLPVAPARIDTLLHLPPDAPLPPPPEQVPRRRRLPDEAAPCAAALAQRPDLKALAERIAAEQASLGLARKDYYPDFEVMAAYDDFWNERPLRPQLAVRLNLPIPWRSATRRCARRRRKSASACAELKRLTNDVNLAVAPARAVAGERPDCPALRANPAARGRAERQIHPAVVHDGQNSLSEPDRRGAERRRAARPLLRGDGRRLPPPRRAGAQSAGRWRRRTDGGRLRYADFKRWPSHRHRKPSLSQARDPGVRPDSVHSREVLATRCMRNIWFSRVVPPRSRSPTGAYSSV